MASNSYIPKEKVVAKYGQGMCFSSKYISAKSGSSIKTAKSGKITVIKAVQFDIPEKCKSCYFHSTEQDMNATLEFCNNPKMPRHNNSCAFVDGNQRHEDCPLTPGEVYKIGVPYKTVNDNIANDPNRCWQPVSKRLPEKDGWYLVKRENCFTDKNGNVHKNYLYEKQRFTTNLQSRGFMVNPPDRPGFYREDYNTGGTESELKDVIAWMNC